MLVNFQKKKFPSNLPDIFFKYCWMNFQSNIAAIISKQVFEEMRIKISRNIWRNSQKIIKVNSIAVTTETAKIITKGSSEQIVNNIYNAIAKEFQKNAENILRRIAEGITKENDLNIFLRYCQQISQIYFTKLCWRNFWRYWEIIPKLNAVKSLPTTLLPKLPKKCGWISFVDWISKKIAERIRKMPKKFPKNNTDGILDVISERIPRNVLKEFPNNLLEWFLMKLSKISILATKKLPTNHQRIFSKYFTPKFL